MTNVFKFYQIVSWKTSGIKMTSRTITEKRENENLAEIDKNKIEGRKKKTKRRKTETTEN